MYKLLLRKTKPAKPAADKLSKNYILIYGFTPQIHHDRGKEFRNSLLQRHHQLFEIKSTKTVPYHRMKNRQAEKMNCTIINMLKTLNETEKSSWKDHLLKLVFAYNSIINKSASYSPFFSMFRRSSKLQIDSIFDVLNSPNNPKLYDKFVAEWKESMQQVINIANKNADKARHLCIKTSSCLVIYSLQMNIRKNT